MISTLITIRDSIQTFVDGHGQLKSVTFESDDQRANYITENSEFPLLFVAPIDVNVGRAMNTHTLRIYVYERINHDRTDLIENANDTSLILRDIRVWWNDYGNSDIHIIEDVTGQFGCDRELDKLVGYFADIRFEIPSHGRCDVPVNVTPSPPPPSCEPVTYNVEYADGTPIESGSEPSGGSIEVIVPNPAPVTWSLIDTDDNVLDSGSEPAGGTLTITAPDATVNINGNFFEHIRSGSTRNINILKATGNDLIGNAQGSHWRIPNSAITLKDTANNTISTTNVPATESANITAPNGNVTINRDGTLYDTQAVKSNGTATVNVPSLCNALPTKTGQTSSYNAGDNGDNQFGRNVSFFRHWRNTPFGNDWRFTSRAGAYHDGTNFRNLSGTIVTKAVAFQNNLMVDWATANGDEFGGVVIMWNLTTVNILTAVGLTQTWAHHLAAQSLLNLGGYTDWRLPNENVVQMIKFKSPTVRHFGYEPFGLTSGQTYWTNETRHQNTAQALVFNNDIMEQNSATIKTNTTNRGLYFRLATYSKDPLTGIVTFT